MNPFSYPQVEPRFNLHLKEATVNWRHYDIDFPVAQPTQYPEHNTGYGEYFCPPEGHQQPLAILTHGWGDRSLIPCQFLAKALVKQGISCFILYLVFHSRRMPEVIKKRLPHLTPEEWFEGYRISVIDVRQVIDWASRREEINKERIAVIGLSLGGFITAISMGVDKRISAGVFLLSGGNYENPLWLKGKKDSAKQAEYEEAQSFYTHYLAQVAEKGYENVIPPKISYLTDPMTFARYLRERPVMMVNAHCDERIPRQATLEFWEACGKPVSKWLPTTHTSIWLLYPLVRREIISFLKSTFNL